MACEIIWQVRRLCGRGQHEKGLQLADQAVDAARREGDPAALACALVARSYVKSFIGDREGALADAEEACGHARHAAALLPLAFALWRKADALRMLDRYEEALSAADEAAEAAREAGDPLALANALRSKAEALRMLGRYEQALSAADEAAEAAREARHPLPLANALISKADALRMLDRYEEAVAAAREAVQAAERTGIAAVIAYCNFALLLAAAARGDKETVEQAAARLPEELRPTAELFAAALDKASEMAKQAEEEEEKLRSQLRQEPKDIKPVPKNAKGAFIVLRRWASYRVIGAVADDVLESGVSGAAAIRGGGYFISWCGKGIVIDPGLGFLSALRADGLVPRNIDAVVLTHHRIDHTGDMLPLMTILFEMYDSGTRHPVNFYLSPSTFGAFSSTLVYLPNVSSVRLLRPDEITSLDAGGVNVGTIKAVRAIHRDLSGREDGAIGLMLNLHDPESGQSCTVGVTSDTRYYAGLGSKFANVHLLVVHIGSVYPPELDEERRSRRWHLGLDGVLELLREARSASNPSWDPLVLISEWGEELRDMRETICDRIRANTGVSEIWPAEALCRVALWPGDAKPVCTEATDVIAGSFEVGSDGLVRYKKET